ncbi:MAG: RNase adaptor protein RapZ, partial [Yaniella sp.]|nr:RNase adaptor protein RapZ [Yaniella sp.]
VLERKGVASFIDSYVAMMEPVIEGYRSENKHYATLAFGCTGGKHRSVAIAEEIAKRLATYSGVKAKISHRDKGRE